MRFSSMGYSVRSGPRNELGIVAMEVWAKTERAKGFYVKFGFEALLDDQHHLYLALGTARRLLEP